jgi:hypothetical protein
MIRQVGVALVVVALCAGCATSYKTKEEDTATVMFVKGFRSGANAPGVQVYYISDTNKCSGSKPAATMKKWSDGNRSVKVPANQTVIVSARTSYVYATGVKLSGDDARANNRDRSCEDALSFTPVVGRIYRVQHDAAFGRSCRLEIIDRTTNKPPQTDRVGGNCPPG